MKRKDFLQHIAKAAHAVLTGPQSKRMRTPGSGVSNYTMAEAFGRAVLEVIE